LGYLLLLLKAENIIFLEALKAPYHLEENMKKMLLTLSIALTFCSLLMAETKPATDSTYTNMPTSKKQILKLSDAGLEPQTLKMTTDDSIVFFLNDTNDSLTSLEVDFRGKTAHCASANMVAEEDGFVRSTKPFGPKDFATTCFHAPGTYAYTVYGLKQNPKGIKGTIVVE